MEGLTQGAVQSDLKSQQLSQAELTQAKKRLDHMKETHSDISSSLETINLFCALRRIKCRLSGREDIRISAPLLRTWKVKTIQTTFLRQTFWIVPRAGNPDLNEDADIRPAILHADDFEEFPQNLDPATVFIVDQKVERSKLRFGVSTLELSIGVARSKHFGSPPPSSARQAPQP